MSVTIECVKLVTTELVTIEVPNRSNSNVQVYIYFKDINIR